MLLCFLSFISIGKAVNPNIIDSLNSVLAKSIDVKIQINTLFKLSDEFYESNPRLALKYYQQAYEIAKNAGEDKEAVNSLLNMIEVSYTLSDLKNAMEYAFLARELAEKNDFRLELAIILDHMGMICYDIGDRQKCSNLYFMSLRIYEELNEKEGVCKTLSWIGLLYYDQHNYTKSWEYYSKSLELAKEIKSQEGIAANLNNLSKVLWSRKLYRESLTYLEESLQINQKLNNPTAVASNYLNIGFAYYSLKEYDDALKYYNKALDIFTRVSNKVRIAMTRIKIGETYLDRENIEECILNARIALEIGQKNGFKDVIYQSSKLMHQIFLAQKDTINAYKFKVIESQWGDSLSMNAKEKNLTSLEIHYQMEKKEQEHQIVRQKRNALILSAFIFLALSIVIILLILNQLRLKAKKTKLEKKNLEQELDFNKKQLVFNVMSLMKQNEIFTDLSKKILQLENQTGNPEALVILKSFGSEIRKRTDKDSLKEFSLRFKEIHKDFYSSLLEKFPNLTPNELRLCAFLKMQMTTKEISELTGQQLNTLEHARYKLRQKLGISNSEVNLVTFIAQI